MLAAAAVASVAGEMATVHQKKKKKSNGNGTDVCEKK